MALTRIDNPTPSAPAALADYVQILAKQTNAILQSLRNNSHACIDFTNNYARAGVVFHVAGVLYKAVTDQAIGGTPSKYVKITPSGATASIDYVSSLSGVSWNDEQSGYYDGSVSNLYVFDEARAVYDGVISSPKTNEGQIAYVSGSLSVKNAIIATGGITENSVTLKRKVIDIGDWNMDSTAILVLNWATISGGIAISSVRKLSVLIRDDGVITDSGIVANLQMSDGDLFYLNAAGSEIVLQRSGGGFFDSVSFNATSYNRGWIFVDYVA